MINEYRRPIVDLLAGALMAGGLLVVFLGWFGLRDQQSVVEQLPYLASGGIGGLALLGTGIAILHLTRQARLEQRMTELSARQEALEDAMQAIAVALGAGMDVSEGLRASLGRGGNGSVPALRDTDEPADQATS